MTDNFELTANTIVCVTEHFTSKLWVLEVSKSGEKKWYLQAENVDDMKSWLHELKATVVKCKYSMTELPDIPKLPTKRILVNQDDYHRRRPSSPTSTMSSRMTSSSRMGSMIGGTISSRKQPLPHHFSSDRLAIEQTSLSPPPRPFPQMITSLSPPPRPNQQRTSASAPPSPTYTTSLLYPSKDQHPEDVGVRMTKEGISDLDLPPPRPSSPVETLSPPRTRNAHGVHTPQQSHPSMTSILGDNQEQHNSSSISNQITVPLNLGSRRDLISSSVSTGRPRSSSVNSILSVATAHSHSINNQPPPSPNVNISIQLPPHPPKSEKRSNRISENTNNQIMPTRTQRSTFNATSTNLPHNALLSASALELNSLPPPPRSPPPPPPRIPSSFHLSSTPPPRSSRSPLPTQTSYFPTSTSTSRNSQYNVTPPPSPSSPLRSPPPSPLSSPRRTTSADNRRHPPPPNLPLSVTLTGTSYGNRRPTTPISAPVSPGNRNHFSMTSPSHQFLSSSYGGRTTTLSSVGSFPSNHSTSSLLFSSSSSSSSSLSSPSTRSSHSPKTSTHRSFSQSRFQDIPIMLPYTPLPRSRPPTIPLPPTPTSEISISISNLEAISNSQSFTPEPSIELSDDDQLDPDYADEVAASIGRNSQRTTSVITDSSTLSYYFSSFNEEETSSIRENISDSLEIPASRGQIVLDEERDRDTGTEDDIDHDEHHDDEEDDEEEDGEGEGEGELVPIILALSPEELKAAKKARRIRNRDFKNHDIKIGKNIKVNNDKGDEISDKDMSENSDHKKNFTNEIVETVQGEEIRDLSVEGEKLTVATGKSTTDRIQNNDDI